LGRDALCDLTLEDGSCSRRHARVGVDPAGTAYVEDLGSTNGTLLNGKSLATRSTLQEGDRIRIGATFLLFKQQEPTFDFMAPPEVDELQGGDTVNLRPTGGSSLAAEADQGAILAGRMDALGMVELLQLLLQTRADGKLVLRFSDGDAELELRRGVIRSASYRNTKGLPALFSMALRGAGTFAFHACSDEVEGSMCLGLQEAVFQLCRVLDEYESDEAEPLHEDASASLETESRV